MALTKAQLLKAYYELEDKYLDMLHQRNELLEEVDLLNEMIGEPDVEYQDKPVSKKGFFFWIREIFN